MAIQALPPATSRILNSSQVLTTPVSLVKELIDNALDARASRIDILISMNTLDKIEVRDNGHGIAPGDFDALGRRGYTSKLLSFEDLKVIGGVSLGFRGEALASAVELGQVTITTRTDGEAVGTAIRLKAPGGVESQATASHPVGTTVSVVGFLARLPVRKQTAQKESKKTLSKIKDMLQSYALARLKVRLSLKVLKAGKSNWSFAPRQDATVRQVVAQVIGVDTAAQCMEKMSVWNPNNNAGCDGKRTTSLDTSSVARVSEKFIFQAFLPKQDADFSKIGGGHHVSIDGRPVSCARGTLKKLVGIYRTYIRALTDGDIADNVKNPFIRVNIVCPVGSYDPNVEPAKDDVIFESENILLASVELWFKIIYGSTTPTTVRERLSIPLDANFQYRLAEQDAVISQRNQTRSKPLENKYTSIFTLPRTLRSLSPPQKRSMLSHKETPRQVQHQQDVEQGTIEAWLDRSSSENPAKCDPVAAAEPLLTLAGKAPVSATLIGRGVKSRGDFVTAGILPTVQLSNQDQEIAAMEGRFGVTSSPQVQNSRMWDFDVSRDIYEEAALPQSSSELPRTRRLTIVRESNEIRTPTALNPWIIARLNAPIKASRNSPRPAQSQQVLMENIEGTTNPDSHEDIAFANHSLNPTCPSRLQPNFPKDDTEEIDYSGGRKNSGPVTRPFKIPTPARAQNPNVHEDSRSDLELESNSLGGVVNMLLNHPRPIRAQRASLYNNVEDALDFERRKEDATRKLRDQIRAQNAFRECSTATTSSAACDGRRLGNVLVGPLSSYTACKSPSNVQGLPEARRPAVTTLPDGDSRAYLMRRQKSSAALGDTNVKPKLKRMKTAMLPLEFIPDVDRLHRLLHVVTTDVDTIRKCLNGLGGGDDWAFSGNRFLGLNIPASQLTSTEERIQSMVKRLQLVANSEKCDVIVDLSILRERSVVVF